MTDMPYNYRHGASVSGDQLSRHVTVVISLLSVETKFIACINGESAYHLLLGFFFFLYHLYFIF